MSKNKEYIREKLFELFDKHREEPRALNITKAKKDLNITTQELYEHYVTWIAERKSVK